MQKSDIVFNFEEPEESKNSNKPSEKRQTIFEQFGQLSNLIQKRRLFCTQIEKRQQFQIIRVKETMATVYMLYAIEGNNKIFVCGTKKQVGLVSTQFELSLNRDMLSQIKGTELYVGHVRSNFSRDMYYFFQNSNIDGNDQKRASGWLEETNTPLGNRRTTLTLKTNQNQIKLISSDLTEKEKFDLKHAWLIVDSKKNIVMRVQGQQPGLPFASIILGKNTNSRMTLIVTRSITAYQAFSFAIAHLTFLE